MPGKVLLVAAAVLMAGAGLPANDMYLGRVAGSADAVDAHLTLEPAHPTVPVRVSNTSGKPGRVVGWLGDKAATASAPDHSGIVTLTWDSPALAGGDSGVLRLELYPQGDTLQPMDIEEHPYTVSAGTYQGPSQPPTQWPSGGPSGSPTEWPSGSPSWSPPTKPSRSSSPKPSHSTSKSPKPSHSASESPRPSHSGSGTPGPSSSSSSGPSSGPSSSSAPGEVLPQTGSGTSLVAVLGGGSVLFGMMVLGLAWVLRKRSLRDRLF